MATEYTPYYNLDLYTDADKPNLRDQYNAAMRKVDTQLHTSNDNITVAIEAANQAKEKAQEANDAVAAETTAREAADNALETAYKAADTVLDGKITAEATARTAADSALETAYKEADSVLDGKITAEATARTAADSALGVRIDAEATARANADSALSDRIDALEPFTAKTKYYGHRMVVIGDSYAYGTGASDHGGAEQLRFSTRLANMLGAVEVNVAVGSTGFCDPGSGGQNASFPTQVSQAAAKLNATQRNDVRLVLIAGGINDEHEGVTYSRAQMATAAKNTCTAAKASFPNADIVVFPMLWNGQKWQYHAFNFECGIVEGVMQSNCGTAVQGCWTWNFGDAAKYATDNLHPNDAGHLNFANRMLESIMQGGTMNYQNYLFVPTINGGSTVNRTYGVFQNGTMHFGGMYVGTSGEKISGNTKIGTVPPGMYPEVNVYAPIFKNNQLAGMFCVTVSGNVYINPTSEVTAPVYVAPCDYVPYGGTLN
jgi:lysophospholipase L1-like esterase